MEFRVQDKELRKQYSLQIPGLLADLKKAAQQWIGNPKQEFFDEFFTKILNISGSAAMFGHIEIGNIAKLMQDEMSPFFRSDKRPTEPEIQHIIGINQQLLSMMQQAETDPKTEIREIQFKAKIIDKEFIHIIVLENDPVLAKDIKQKLTSTSFEISTISEISQITSSVQANTGCIIVSLDSLAAEDLTALGNIEKIRASIPLIFTSESSSISARLKAVQAGGQAFISKPLDYTQVLRSIDSLTERQQQQQYRILIIDDQKSLSDYYASILKASDFEVLSVNNPEHELMPALADFEPDLILLDLYMPYCNGQELAGIIRQMDNLLSIPLIFLSAEASTDLQLRAMSTGADAFLTKPVSPDDLLLTVQSRIKRGRAVYDLVTKDPLSGLLNRRESIRRLEEEISRSRRKNTPLSVAMIDLDHFKKINDTLGHSVGDWVIKFFARSMQLIFRECDIIGRYGGEEFIIIFPDTLPEAAQMACKRLKKYIIASTHDLPTSFTYSGGIALLNDQDDSKTILDRADIALYKAKEKGRNKVITATDNPTH
jgi:diguanylate cyclase (GGDEF)-like protein